MKIACIDMEGVLVPELWPLVAAAAQVPALLATSRECPDYRGLVARRIDLLGRHGIRLADLRRLLRDIAPLPGVEGFLERLRADYRVVIVSDAFREMIEPLWLRLGAPELRCHHFVCDEAGFVSQACYTRMAGKHEVVEAFAAEGHETVAVGDALNDLSMLHRADRGFLFRPSAETRRAAGCLPVVETHEAILLELGLA